MAHKVECRPLDTRRTGSKAWIDPWQSINSYPIGWVSSVILIYKGQLVAIITNQSRAELNVFESCFQTIIRN